MKKVIVLVLSIFLVTVTFTPCVSAATSEPVQTEYFEDGSYISVGFNLPEDSEDEENATSSFFQRIIEIFKKILALLFGKDSSSVVSKTKYAKYYDANGTLLWTVYLTAEFLYNGKNSSCTKVSYSYDIDDSDWSFVSADCSRDGARATGIFTVKQYKLAVPLKTVEKTLTLSCDKNGNIT